MKTPKSYKTGNVNRFRIGPWDALGKGQEEDENGNVLYDYLEVLGFRVSEDARKSNWTKYGKMNLTSLEESRFEELSDYWDIEGNPDYASYIDKLNEMKSVVYGEILYFALGDISGSLVLSVTKTPLIINDSDMFNIKIISGDTVINIDRAAITFQDYCPEEIDRLNCAKKREFTLNLDYSGSGFGYALEAGDMIVCDYTYFHHTDMLRDANAISQWESGYTADTSIEIEFFVDADRYAPINHIELQTSDIDYSTGAKEYIIQAVEETLGIPSYRTIKAGYLPEAKKGEINVIKFDLRSVNKVRLILMGTVGKSFIEMNLFVSDPDLLTHYKKYPTVDTLETEDFYKVSIIPFYNSPTAPNTSFVQGLAMSVNELTGFAGGTVYIPGVYNGANEVYHDYVLTYVDVYYSGILVYRGIPNPFLVSSIYLLDTQKLGTYEVGVCSSSDFTADVYHIFNKDYLTLSSQGNEKLFYTRFRNISSSKFMLYKVDKSGNETLLAPGSEYYVSSQERGIINLIDPLEVGYALYAVYTYTIRKQGEDSPYDYIDVLRLFGWREAIRYSSIKVYPQQYFLQYFPNNESQIMEFEYNPSTWSNQPETNQTLVKTIGGTYRKQKFGITKGKFTMRGEKISEEMHEMLLTYEQETIVLGLVDDMLKVHKGFITPGSLQGERRKTTKTEQEEETTSWSYSFTFQEV